MFTGKKDKVTAALNLILHRCPFSAAVGPYQLREIRVRSLQTIREWWSLKCSCDKKKRIFTDLHPLYFYYLHFITAKM